MELSLSPGTAIFVLLNVMTAVATAKTAKGRPQEPPSATGCQGLGKGEICCRTTFFNGPVKKDHASHTDCCVNPDTLQVKTFDASVKFCDQQTGTPLKYPNLNLFLGPPVTPEGNQKECRRQPYNPSTQICCSGHLHNCSEKDSVCCGDKPFWKNDTTNNPCMRECGRKWFNTENQICCAERNIWDVQSDTQKCCGDQVHDTEHQICCNGMVLHRKSRMECCNDTLPYYPGILRCANHTHSLQLRKKKIRGQNLPNKICSKKLYTWGEAWPTPLIPDVASLIHIQGRVERCGVRVRRNKVTIPLTPAFSRMGGVSVSRCMKDRRLKLVIRLPAGQTCMTDREARHYLQDKTLDIFVPQDKLQCTGKKGRATVQLESGDLALIFMSKRMDAMFVQSSPDGGL